MRILVDTCIWSKVLRRKTPDPKLTNRLKELIRDARATIIGPIRQEILSGISNDIQYTKLKKTLSAFEDISLKSQYFTYAAELCNRCRKSGIQGSTTDFLICSVALNLNMVIFTIDNDFKQYQKYIKIKLF